MKKVLVFVFIMFNSAISMAVVEVSPNSQIERIFSFSTFGDGDIAFKLQSNGSKCVNGYWLRRADAGFKENFSILLSAFHAQSNLVIQAETADVWSGSGGVYCRVTQVDIRR